MGDAGDDHSGVLTRRSGGAIHKWLSDCLLVDGMLHLPLRVREASQRRGVLYHSASKLFYSSIGLLYWCT